MAQRKCGQTRSQLFGVLIIFWAYLVFGALIFSAIEKRHADDLHREFAVAAVRFMTNNSCVTRTDLQTYSNVLITAYSGGLRWTEERGFNTSKYGYHHWDLIDSLFFCATVVTTIGYGHMSPSTNLGRSICIIYALIGIPLSGLLVTIIGQQLKKRLKRLWKRLLARLNFITSAKSSTNRRVALISAVIFAAFGFYIILIIIPACLFNYLEGWDWLTSHYYSFISFTTIGFGDFVAGDSPALSVAGRVVYKILLIFYLVFGMGFLTLLLQGMQQKNADRVRRFTRRKVIRRILKKRRIRKVDQPDGDISMVSSSDEGGFVVITTNVYDDDIPGEQFELRDLEGEVEYETVSIIDIAVQTIVPLLGSRSTQTDDYHLCTSCDKLICHGDKMIETQSNLTNVISSYTNTTPSNRQNWEITVNALCTEASTDTN